MSESLTAEEVSKVLMEHNWEVETNPFQMFAIGPVDENGIMNVVGMGPSFADAFRMAKESIK